MEERNCLEGETRVREEVTQLSSNERRHVFSTYSHLSDSHSSVRKSKSHLPGRKECHSTYSFASFLSNVCRTNNNNKIIRKNDFFLPIL